MLAEWKLHAATTMTIKVTMIVSLPTQMLKQCEPRTAGLVLGNQRHFASYLNGFFSSGEKSYSLMHLASSRLQVEPKAVGTYW